MITVTVPVDARQFRTLSDAELARVWSDGRISLPALERECARRNRADAKRAQYEANKAAWWEAAHAQYEQASADCAGRLLSDLGMASVASETALWTGADDWAAARASEELRNWWAESWRPPVVGALAV